MIAVSTNEALQSCPRHKCKAKNVSEKQHEGIAIKVVTYQKCKCASVFIIENGKTEPTATWHKTHRSAYAHATFLEAALIV